MAENPHATELHAPDLQIIRICNHYAEAVRRDGLTVFLDSSKDDLAKTLNHLRASASAESLIRILGIARGHQISLSYARRYMPEALPGLEADFTELKSTLINYVRGGCAGELVHRSISPRILTSHTESVA